LYDNLGTQKNSQPLTRQISKNPLGFLLAINWFARIYLGYEVQR
jgi:hypothetical protein